MVGISATRHYFMMAAWRRYSPRSMIVAAPGFMDQGSSQSDYIDAEAIAEAVTRPRMRFVPILIVPHLVSCLPALNHNLTFSPVRWCCVRPCWKPLRFGTIKVNTGIRMHFQR